MNEKINCITDEGKTTENERKNDNSDILQALYNVYKKSGQFFFHTYLITGLKKRYISSVKSYIYLNKYLKILCIYAQSL